MYLSTVFGVLSKFCLCDGFPVVAKRTAKDARGNIVGPLKNGTVVMILQLPCTSALPGTAEGEGLVGPRPHHFFAPPPLLFALKRKKIKIKKRLEISIFPSIFRYILCIFLNFKGQAFCGTPVL